MEKVSSGAEFLDGLLNGGYDKDVVTTIYGPSGTGKTNLCLLSAVGVALTGKKVIFIDTEGGIAVERIKQISAPNHEKVLGNIVFFKPLSFSEQIEVFETLREMVSSSVGMVVVDSISMLYRLELGKSDDIYDVNSSLGRQIAYLVEIARRHKIPVLITNQVYADFHSKKVKMVGGDLMKYGSKCLIELDRSDEVRSFVLRKHRHLPEGISVKFNIIQEGLEKV
jgi:DNA repair protein RadB